MITFITPTALPIEAATTMGVSVKDGDAIGKFGTGLKYAIAGILRLGGSIVAHIDGERHEFDARSASIRGREFRIVHHNGVPCGFTTELGKHWEPWQLFRELASNTLDEHGSWTREETSPDSARTVIQVRCREVEDSEREEQVFIAKTDPLIESSLGATVYAAPSRHYYFRGIRAGSFRGIAPVTVDVCNGSLSEDRLLDLSTVQTELAWAFRTTTKFDETFMLSVLAQHEAGDFWVENINQYQVGTELPEPLIAFLSARPKFVKHPALRKALDGHLRKGRIGRWDEIQMDARHQSLVRAGEELCRQVGVDLIPRERVHFTRDLGDSVLALTCMDTRDVWFSTKLAMLGRDEFLSGYLEEAMHAMTGYQDCTRELQNALLSLVIANATREPSCAEAA
jgi:hypothetical protein